MKAQHLVATMAAIAGGLPDLPRGSRGNKYRTRDNVFVVILHDCGKTLLDPDGEVMTFSSRVDAHDLVRPTPHTVKPLGSLAAQAAS